MIILPITIAIPIIITIPYAFRQNQSQYRHLTSFIPITVALYLKVINITGIVLASIASLMGVGVFIRFFLFRKKFLNVALELRLLVVVMISNVGCIGYNICQVLIFKAYLSEDIRRIAYDRYSVKRYEVGFFDELGKSILIFHHYMSFILLIIMRFEWKFILI